jgi:hypothetical protein
MANNGRVHVFVSYSHKDLRWLRRLKVHLAPLARQYDFDLWNDRRLTPRSKWRQLARRAGQHCEIIASCSRPR